MANHSDLSDQYCSYPVVLETLGPLDRLTRRHAN